MRWVVRRSCSASAEGDRRGGPPRTVSSVLAALMIASALSACGEGNAPPPGASATAAATPSSEAESPEMGLAQAVPGQPFRNGSFEITVTKVSLGVKLIDVDADAKSGGVKGYKLEIGQFIMVYLTAKNVGDEPATMSTTDSTLTDARGKSFEAGGPYLYADEASQGLGDDRQQPDTTRKGWIAFDVPLSVTKVDFVTIQSDAFMETTNLPTPVKIG